MLTTDEKISFLTDYFKEHAERIRNYERYQKLFLGKHHDVFSKRVLDNLARNYGEGVYIVINMPKVISLVSADLLFGEPPEIRAIGQPEDELHNLLLRSNAVTLFYELAIGASVKGDAFLKVYMKDGEVYLGSVNPSHVYPEFDISGEIKKLTIAFIKEIDRSRILFKETHTPGLIVREAIDTRNNARVPVGELFEEMAEVEETGLDAIPIVHIPNYRDDTSFFGISDYVDIESIVDELNNRFSENARILDKHSDPKLLLPEDIFNELMKFEGRIKKQDLQVIGLPEGSSLKPEYLTWDAQLTNSFEHIRLLLQMLMTVTEIAPDVIGLSEGGGQAESGRALRFRALRTLSKVRRKALYFDIGIKKALKIADALSRNYLNKPIGDSFEIVWKDGLPQDPVEAAQVENIRTGGRPTTSVVSAIKRLDGVSLEGAIKELERMRKEQSTIQVEDLE